MQINRFFFEFLKTFGFAIILFYFLFSKSSMTFATDNQNGAQYVSALPGTSSCSTATARKPSSLFDISAMAQTTSCTHPDGSLFPSNCWNSQQAGTSTCGLPCDAGNSWSKYDFSGCYQDPNTFGNPCTGYYLKDQVTVCSTADKCGDANGSNTGPYLNAGTCSCTVGATYKTCCSGSNVSSNSCVQQVNFPGEPVPPYDGVCPAGTTTVPCGSDPSIYAALGYPYTGVACGAAACAGPATCPSGTSCTTSDACAGTCSSDGATCVKTDPACPAPNCGQACTTTDNCAGTISCTTNACVKTDSACPAPPSVCPTTGGWTGQQCSGPSAPNLAQTCPGDPTACNKCTSAVCILYNSFSNLYCYYNNTSLCYTDTTFCKGFGNCGTCIPGSTKTECSTPNTCSLP